MKIVCISDTHGMHRDFEIPNGDVLVFAGDMCSIGNLDDISDFNAFLGKLPHKHKVVVCGNHDWAFEREPEQARSLMTNCIYLQDEGCEIDGMKFWGSPWQPEFGKWAFNLPRGVKLCEKWSKIPSDIDILVTHSPPFGICDLVVTGRNEGCEELLEVVQHIKPRLNVFGHIHEAYGKFTNEHTIFANASICTFDYRPTNPAIVIDL
ncbi:MAG: metallophosphatase domain-containing protein [Planctomycetes bacterium]|nr:metallophosphatase domain-containing protein [Planctomycetota bacterium]